jgi:HMGL-like
MLMRACRSRRAFYSALHTTNHGPRGIKRLFHKRHPSLSTPKAVKIVEVGPRDGLQNEPEMVSIENKITLISKLTEAGCTFIEAGSFVSPMWVPSMSNSVEVMKGLNELRGSSSINSSVVFSCLVPNLQGLERAIQVKADEIAIFGSASEAFSQKVGNLVFKKPFSCLMSLTPMTAHSVQEYQLQHQRIHGAFPRGHR